MLVLWRRMRGAVGGIGPTEWALLAIETLAVIAGIIIAFQLQEWATDRCDREDQDRVLHRLLNESQLTLAVHRRTLEGNRARLAEAAPWLDAMAQNTCPDAAAWAAAAQAQYLYDPVEFLATYDEAVATGALRNIDDDRLSEALGLLRDELRSSNDDFDYYADRAPPIERDFDEIDVVVGKRANNYRIADPFAACANRDLRQRLIGNLLSARELLQTSEFVIRRVSQVCGGLAIELQRTCEPAFGGPLEGQSAEIAADPYGKMDDAIARARRGEE